MQRANKSGAGSQGRRLSELEFLLMVDDEARLRFRRVDGPFLAPPTPAGRVPPLVALPKLLRATTRVLKDTDREEDLRLLIAPGSSVGGARPKATVRGTDGRLFIAKFSRPDDPYDVNAWEHVALTLAKNDTTATCDVELVTSLRERFTRGPVEIAHLMLRRLSLAVLLALLACSAVPPPRTPPGTSMSIENSSIVVEQTCAASPDAVWSALSDPKQMSQWFFEPIEAFEPTVGFETRFVVTVEGTDYVHLWRITDVVPGRTLAYQWHYEGVEGDSQVLWEITSTGSLGTTVRLTHRGHASFPRDNPVFSRAAGVGGWTYFLDRLAKHVAGQTDAAHEHHGIDYFEINVSDLDAAKKFYADAFGWSFNDYGPTYAGIRKGEGEAGGLRLVDSVTPGGPLIILYSANLEDSVEHVRASGGTIAKEIFQFPGGRRFEFTDPSGNLLAVWSDRQPG